MRKIRHVSSSVATVMPEIGFDEEPISPVSRDDTVTNRKPKTTISSAPSRFMCSGARSEDRDDQHHDADADELHRQVALGAQHGDACAAARRFGSPHSPARMPCRMIGSERSEADDAARRHRAGADVEHVGAADLVGAHVADRHRARRQRPGQAFAEELDQRDQHQVRQHAARHMMEAMRGPMM